MKRNLLIPFLVLLIMVSSLFARKVEKVHKGNKHCCDCLENIDVDIDDGSLILTCEYDRDQWIEITPDHELYVSGERIHLNRHEQQLVSDYYEHFFEIIDKAKDIGKEGAKIGIEGAKVGLIAASRAMKMILTDYDQEDFESEIEDEAEELEIRAEKLEDMAEELEDVADEFEEIHYTMKSDINELNDLEWF